MRVERVVCDRCENEFAPRGVQRNLLNLKARYHRRNRRGLLADWSGRSQNALPYLLPLPRARCLQRLMRRDADAARRRAIGLGEAS